MVTSEAGSERTTSSGQAGGQDGRALTLDLRLERDAEADLHVGGTQFDLTALGDDLHTGERLDRRAGRGDARDGLQLGEQLLRRSLQLHDEPLLNNEIGKKSSGVLMCAAA
jgi:hypothetical protein